MNYTQPVKVGDEINVDIINIGEKGDGVTKHDGFIIIVPNGKIEENYKVRIRKVFDKFALADIIEDTNGK